MSATSRATTHTDFLAAIHPHDGPDLLELRSLPSKAQAFIRPGDIEAAERFIRAHTQENIYFGIASRRNAGDGSLENCGLLHVLFVDLDFKDTPGAEARAKLTRFPFTPSIVVRSGGGLHCYWILKEPFDLQDSEDRKRVKNLLRRLALALGGDMNAAEPARILRIPGTLNHKPEYGTPRPVLIEAFNPTRTYNPSDFDDVLPEEPEPTTNANGHEQRADWLTLLQGVSKGERYGAATRIAGHFLGIGRPVAEVETLLLGYLSQCTPPGDAEERDKARRMVRDFAAKDAAAGNSNLGTDPLAALRVLPASPAATDIEAALRVVISALAGVDELKRATLRQEALSILKAKKVDGPARLVDAAMGLLAHDSTAAGENAIFLADPEPWADPVDGAALLDAIKAMLLKFIIMPVEETTACTLWIVFAHAHDASGISPILAIQAPTIECGKSTLAELSSEMTPRPLPSSNITPQAVYRTIEKYHPTLIIDEADALLPGKEDLRGILDAAHARKMAKVIRLVGDDFEPIAFSTWCPKMLVGIGALPKKSLQSRSIVIVMKRATAQEKRRVTPFVLREKDKVAPDLLRLCRQAARWAKDNLETLRAAAPSIPDELFNRASDNWTPLLAIADLAGGEWPTLARKAAKSLSGATHEHDEADSLGVLLVGDIMAIFNDRKADKLPTSEIIADLIKLDTRPWCEFNHGKSITARGIARLLKPFEIRPKTERMDKDIFKGYVRERFIDAFTRYFGGSNPLQALQHNEITMLDSISDPLQDPFVTDTKSDISIYKQSIVTDVTDKNLENGQVDADGEVVDPEFDCRDPEHGPPVGAWETI